jgi:hypothetical protein
VLAIFPEAPVEACGEKEERLRVPRKRLPTREFVREIAGFLALHERERLQYVVDDTVVIDARLDTLDVEQKGVDLDRVERST